MSQYRQYLQERTGGDMIEDHRGFMSYIITGKDCYIEDMYVSPEYRHQKVALEMANQISDIAKEKGCKRLLGTVVPNTRGSTNSLRLLIAYGFKLDSSTNNLIVLTKDIE